MKVIQMGTGGFKIRFDYQTALAALTESVLSLTDPDGIVTTHDLTIADTTWVEYLVTQWDFDKEGIWTYQSIVATLGWRLPSFKFSIQVNDISEEVT